MPENQTADRQDGARYRWLKENASMTLGLLDAFEGWEAGIDDPAYLDGLIDCEIEREGAGDGH